MKDLISRQAAIDALHMHLMYRMGTDSNKKRLDDWINSLPSAQETHDKRTETHACDLISRQAAIDAVNDAVIKDEQQYAEDALKALPSAQPEKEKAKRVLWTGWKGCRDTRYKCPNCKKPVKNDDIYCHRCGQRLMFPNISFTDYVPGEKQETIVRWDDE